MSLVTLTLAETPVDVAISKSGTHLAVLTSHHLAVYTLAVNTRPVSKPSLLWKSDISNDQFSRHVAFIGDDQIFVLTDGWDLNESCLWQTQEHAVMCRGPVVETENISALMTSVDKSSLHLQLQSGVLLQVITDDAATDLPPQTSIVQKFPSSSAELQVIHVSDGVRKSNLHLQ